MKAAACLAVLLCAIAYSQPEDSANRSAAAPPPAHESTAVKLLHPLEPEPYFTPLTPRERLREYVYGAFGPYAIFRAAAAAAVFQALDRPHEWGGGTTGYAERFTGLMGEAAAQRAIAYGLSAAFHEDNRYFATGREGKMDRAFHAALAPFEARHEDGTIGFSYSNVAGVVGASLISRAWVPPSWRSGSAVARTIGFTFAGEAAFDVFREFLPDILRHRR